MSFFLKFHKKDQDIFIFIFYMENVALQGGDQDHLLSNYNLWSKIRDSTYYYSTNV